jgi:hypothetical protein
MSSDIFQTLRAALENAAKHPSKVRNDKDFLLEFEPTVVHYEVVGSRAERPELI